MTLAPPHPGRRSVPTSSEVFASGSSLARRRMWVALGCLILVVAYFDWQIGHWSPSLVGVTFPTALVIAVLGATVLALGLWRRPRSWQIRSGGIQLVLGGPIFGDRQLIPWGSITHFGGRRTGSDEVCLSFRQQHVTSAQTLSGAPFTVEEYDRLIDRLRIVIGKRYPQLDLGGLAG